MAKFGTATTGGTICGQAGTGGNVQQGGKKKGKGGGKK